MPTLTSHENFCPNCGHRNYQHGKAGCGHVDVARDDLGAETHEPCDCRRPHPLMRDSPNEPLTDEQAHDYTPGVPG